MLVIGLTGGIGSGKSTVANLFAKKGIVIIDTDRIAREMTTNNKDVLDLFVQRFGPNILLKDGSLDRALLRKKIFAHESDRIFVENILHPLIRSQMEKEATQANSPYCIAVIPLLFETKPNPLIKRILVVDAILKAQIQRTVERDKVSEESILSIVKTQVSREKRLQGADDIIVNDGKAADLIPQVEKLHALYLKLAIP